MRDGDHLVNLVGQEYDSYFPDLGNQGTVILAMDVSGSMQADDLKPNCMEAAKEAAQNPPKAEEEDKPSSP